MPSESRAHAPEEGDRNAKEFEVRPGRCIVRHDRVCGLASRGFGWSYDRDEPIERRSDRPGGKGILSPPLRSPALLRRTLSPGLRRILSAGGTADIIAGATIGITDMIRAAQSSRALRLAFWARELQVPRATATAIRAMAIQAMATAGAGEPARETRANSN